MKTLITFYDRKMAIFAESEINARFYGNLMYIKFDKPHCWLYFTENEKFKVEIPLKEMTDNLPKAGFMKCKRSAVVNICYFKKLIGHSRTIEMNDGTTFKLSKQDVNDFRQLLKRTPRISPPCTDCNSCTNDNCESQIVFCRRIETKQKNEPQTE